MNVRHFARVLRVGTCSIMFLVGLVYGAESTKLPADGEKRVAMIVAKMSSELQLTESQAAQIRAILEGHRTQAAALRHNAADTPATRRELHSLHESTQKKVLALLTPAQRKAFRNEMLVPKE